MTHHSGLLGHWLSGAAILLITAVGSSVFADEGGLAPLIKKGYVRVCADKDNLPFSSEEGPTPGFEVELARLIARELGDVENRLKELHHGLEMDRTSCPRFFANQFRVLLTLAAYIFFQELQRRAATTACADAQVTTLRERLIKLAVWVQRSARRIVLHLPVAFPRSRPPRWTTTPASARETLAVHARPFFSDSPKRCTTSYGGFGTASAPSSVAAQGHGPSSLLLPAGRLATLV